MLVLVFQLVDCLSNEKEGGKERDDVLLTFILALELGLAMLISSLPSKVR